MKSLIIFTTHWNIIGGVEEAVMNFLKHYNKKYIITIGFTRDDSSLDRLIEMSKYANILRIKNMKCDLLFDDIIMPSVYVRRPQINGKKYIRWVHGNMKEMNLRMPKDADIYVAVGEECAKAVEEIYDIKPIIIHNSINSDIHELANIDLGLKKGKDLTLTTVARISREKGYERILEIAKQLKETKVDFIWYLVGEGFDKDYENFIKQKFKKIPECIFVGSQKNPFPYYKIADISVLVSDFEAFPYAPLESLILNVPVLTTDFKAAGELIKNGENGFIVKKDLSDFTIDKLFKKYNFGFEYKSDIEKWEEEIL